MFWLSDGRLPISLLPLSLFLFSFSFSPFLSTNSPVCSSYSSASHSPWTSFVAAVQLPIDILRRPLRTRSDVLAGDCSVRRLLVLRCQANLFVRRTTARSIGDCRDGSQSWFVKMCGQFLATERPAQLQAVEQCGVGGVTTGENIEAGFTFERPSFLLTNAFCWPEPKFVFSGPQLCGARLLSALAPRGKDEGSVESGSRNASFGRPERPLLDLV